MIHAAGEASKHAKDLLEKYESFEDDEENEPPVSNRDRLEEAWKRLSWTSQDLETIKKLSEREAELAMTDHTVWAKRWIEPLEKLGKEVKDQRVVTEAFAKSIED
jgi:hypothetical protein